MEKSTPFDFTLEIWGLKWDLEKYFGPKIMENRDMKDLFKDFAADKMLFAQLWDTINYHVAENIDDFEVCEVTYGH